VCGSEQASGDLWQSSKKSWLCERGKEAAPLRTADLVNERKRCSDQAMGWLGPCRHRRVAVRPQQLRPVICDDLSGLAAASQTLEFFSFSY